MGVLPNQTDHLDGLITPHAQSIHNSRDTNEVPLKPVEIRMIYKSTCRNCVKYISSHSSLKLEKAVQFELKYFRHFLCMNITPAHVSFAGKETLRCLALAIKRMPPGQQTLALNDERELTFVGLVRFL